MSKVFGRFYLVVVATALAFLSLQSIAGATDSREERRNIALSKLADFNLWFSQFKKANTDQRKNLESEGYQKGLARRDGLLDLMKISPEEVQQYAISYSDRRSLPDSIKNLTEEKVGGEGRLDLLLTLNDNMQAVESRQILRVGEKEYEVYSYGKNKIISARNNFKFQAIRIGDSLALNEFPVRRLEIAEVEELKQNGKQLKTVCPVSKKDTSNPIEAKGGAVEYGNTLYALCEGGHLELLAEQLMALDTTVTATEAPPVTPIASSWTMGNKTVLYIRVNYPDDLTEPITYDAAVTMMASVDQYMQKSSYKLLSFQATVTPMITLPKTKAEYVNLGTSTILADARKAAQLAGYDYTKYNLEAVRYKDGPGSFAGMAYVGARGVWLKSSAVGTTAHEFGHNLGAYHSNFWKTTDGSVTGPGANQEYGDSFDVMGASSSLGQFNSYWKARFGWMPATAYATINQLADSPSSSQVVRIEAFDQDKAPASIPQALRVVYGKQMWIDFRQAFTSNTYLMNGVGLRWSPWTGSNGGTQLLDSTPVSTAGKTDSALVIGASFSDPATGITLTPIAKYDTVPPTIDLRVDLATVSSIVNRIAISPTSANITEGSSRQFTAKVYDQFSIELTTATVTWQASCGAISAAGLYQAPMGSGTCVVSASLGGITSSINVVVYAPILTKILLSPTTVSLLISQTRQFLVYSYDQYGVTMPVPSAPTWASESCGTITQAGLFTATVAGSCKVFASVSGLIATATANVGDGTTGSFTVSISPTTGTLPVNGVSQFTGTVLDQTGKIVTTATLAWSASCGTVTSTGYYKAPATSGNCQVAAAYSGKTATALLMIYTPTLTQLLITPKAVSLVVSKTQQFMATAQDQYGISMSLATVPTWASGICGQIVPTAQGGLFTATTVGTCNVTATHSGVQGTATVNVTDGTINVGSITITPTSGTLAAGQIRQFTATVLDSSGGLLSGITVAWSATCGTVNSSGLFQAPSLDGNCQVSATAGGKTATAILNIYVPVLKQLIMTPSTLDLAVSKTQQFSLVGKDQYGMNFNLAVAPVWLVGSCGTITQAGLFTATTVGVCNVTASISTVQASATVTVTALRKGRGPVKK
jgi:hypothetical protein